MFDPLMIQFFFGLYFIGVGLPSAVASTTPPNRKPLTDYAQFLFGVVLTALAIFHVVLVK